MNAKPVPLSSKRRERVSFAAVVLFGVAFVGLCIVDANSMWFVALSPLPVVPIWMGPRAYRVVGMVCLVLLIGRGSFQYRREQYRKTHFIEDRRSP